MQTRSFNNRAPRKYFYQSHYKSAGSSGFGRRKVMGRPGQKIDPARFVNKAVCGEKIEDFMP